MDFPRDGVQYGEIDVPWLYKEYLNRGKVIKMIPGILSDHKKIWHEKSEHKEKLKVDFLTGALKHKNAQKNDALNTFIERRIYG